MSYIRDMKNKIRDSYRAKRLELTAEQKSALDSRICKQLRSLASFRFAEVILAYHPLDDEIDIRPLLRDAFQSGKKIAFPRCGEGGVMDFYYVSSLDELEPGKFGIMEPTHSCEKYERSCQTPALMLIPALVYDNLGFRLGYGRGYYDRYVSSYRGIKAGLCYHSFLRATPLPCGRFDFAVDYIVTEKGVRLIEKV